MIYLIKSQTLRYCSHMATCTSNKFRISKMSKMIQYPCLVSLVDLDLKLILNKKRHDD